MRFDMISHRSSYSDCYCINKEEVRINLRTGKEITKVILFHSDPFEKEKVRRGGSPVRMEKKFELKYQDLWTCVLRPEYKREQYYFEIWEGEEKRYLLEDDFYTEEEMHEEGKMYQYFLMPWMNSADIIEVPEWVKDTIWYQIFPDRFCRGDQRKKSRVVKQWNSEEEMSYYDFYGGDLLGILSKLDYLKDLGITGIYLTPINASSSNHKYDTNDYELIDPDFGDEEDLKLLIRKAHELGIRIMIDAVFNHCGWFFEPWQDVVKHGRDSKFVNWFYVNQFPVMNGNSSTRDGRYYSFGFVTGMPKLNTNQPEVMNYLISLCRHWVNDWKVDAIRFDVGNEVSHAFLKKLHLELKQLKPDLFLLGEIWSDAIQWLQGDEYDSVMNYPFLESINDFWRKKTFTFKDLMMSLNRCFTMYSEQTTSVLFNLLDSHDVVRAINRCGSLDVFYQQLTLLFTLQGSVCIYYGTEIALEGEEDPENRRCMPWQQIEEGRWSEQQRKVKQLIALRKKYPQCISPKLEWKISKESPRLVHYVKKGESQEALEIYLNAENQAVTLTSQGTVIFETKYELGQLQPGGILIAAVR